MDEQDAIDQGLEYTIISEAVMDEKDRVVQPAKVRVGEAVDFKAINYQGLIPVLIKATQEQQEVIESQAAMIEQLLERVEALED